MHKRLVVGFHSAAASMDALRWAIRAARAGSRELVVVHTTDKSVMIHNGPSTAVAHQLGNPEWATVHTVVSGLGAPEGTTTIIEPGCHVEALVRHGLDASAIVLGPKRGRWMKRNDTKARLEELLNTPVLRIDDLADEPLTPTLPSRLTPDGTGDVSLGRHADSDQSANSNR